MTLQSTAVYCCGHRLCIALYIFHCSLRLFDIVFSTIFQRAVTAIFVAVRFFGICWDDFTHRKGVWIFCWLIDG